MSKQSKGFQVSIDLNPDVYVSVVDYDELRAGILQCMKLDWGERCETKDIDDFPELHDDLVVVGNQEENRCPVCLVYEKFDAWWDYLVPTP